MAKRKRAPERAAVSGLALWLALAALAAIRVIAALAPGTWVWGLDLLRDAPPAEGWTLWGVAALALVPAVAARALPAARAAGRAIERGGAAVHALAAVAAAGLVVALPDRALFVGDALLRQGTAEGLRDPRVLFPGGPGQALPLDLFLHFTLPRWLAVGGALPVNTTARALGALEAAGLAMLAVAFARALALEGVAALAAAATAFFGGYLGLFTGYDKSFTEMCLVVAAVALGGLRMIREGRGHGVLSAGLCVGFLVHRSVVALLPAAAVAWLAWSRARARLAPRPRAAIMASLAAPVVIAALVGPRILHTFRVLDVSQHLAETPTTATAPLTRFADLVSFFCLMAPLAPLIPLAAAARPRVPARGPEAWFLTALALPFAAMAVGLHPHQGLFRDWDVFAAGGLALALLAAWLAAGMLAVPGRAWLGTAVVAAAIAPTLQWLLIQSDLDRGLSRARALAAGPPARSAVERAAIWDYAGSREIARGRPEAAVEDFARAVAIGPSTRMLYTLGIAEERAGRLREAQASFEGSVAKDPDGTPAWRALGRVAARRGDAEAAWRAAREIARLEPANPAARADFMRLDSLRRTAPVPAP